MKFVNESLEHIFKPKGKEKIIDELCDLIQHKYYNCSIEISKFFKPRITYDVSRTYLDMIYSNEGKFPGFFIQCPDKDVLIVLDLMSELKIHYKKLRHSVFNIDEYKSKETKLIKGLCKLVLDEKLDFIYFKKY